MAAPSPGRVESGLPGQMALPLITGAEDSSVDKSIGEHISLIALALCGHRPLPSESLVCLRSCSICRLSKKATAELDLIFLIMGPCGALSNIGAFKKREQIKIYGSMFEMKDMMPVLEFS